MKNHLANQPLLSIDFTKAWVNGKFNRYTISDNLFINDKLVMLHSLLMTPVNTDVPHALIY